MRVRTVAMLRIATMLGLATIALVGCGEQEQRAATRPIATATATPSATPTATPTAKPVLTRAASTRQCARLWNEDALPLDNPQVSANEFVAELAPIRVLVTFDEGNCYVVMPIGKRRIATFVAVDGRRAFYNPTRRNLKRGERLQPNARADREGLVALD
ncbi:hypothetical protein OJ998_34725 [Solirubrobacter taibaiensis]|nr:hypothetical protein [Solirubrobacter taibaiensis]